MPALRITILSAAPEAVLRSHVHCDFTLWSEATDLGVVNRGALEVLATETEAAYTRFHSDWPAKVDRMCREFELRKVDVVLADIPYLPLAAAARVQIPSVAMCSLNWADIFRYYVSTDGAAREILDVMSAAYANATVFLQPEPSMPMPDLANTRRIGPIARIGTHRADEIRQRLNIGEDQRLVLISLGGIATDFGMNAWPRCDGVTWLVQGNWNIHHPDARAWDAAGFNFIDVLHSCDAFVTKPGYGNFAEAACNGARVLYVPRHDWPEEECLVSWLPKHVPCEPLAKDIFFAGRFQQQLQRIFATTRPVAPPARGIAEAATIIAEYLE